MNGAQQLGFIDCPDHDSDLEMNHLVAYRMLFYADLCIYITTPQKYKTKVVIQTLQELYKKGHTVGVLFNRLHDRHNVDKLWQDLRLKKIFVYR